MLDACTSRLAVRPRVAIALAVADRVLPLLNGDPEAAAAAAHALDMAWQWEEEVGAVRASAVHALIHPMDLLAQRSADPCVTAALHTVELALLFACWHAYAVETFLGRPDPDGVPGELYEVTDEDLSRVARSAVEAGAVTSEGVEALAGCVLAAHDTAVPDAVGRAVPRDYFQRGKSMGCP